jgi:hypothetical protein
VVNGEWGCVDFSRTFPPHSLDFGLPTSPDFDLLPLVGQRQITTTHLFRRRRKNTQVGGNSKLNYSFVE